MSNSRIGIYSGTFDPIHKGHIAFIASALKEAHVDRIYILPESSPRNKHPVASKQQRVAIISEAIKAMDRVACIDLGQERFSIHETLPELKKRFPDSELVFLLGADVFMSMATHPWPSMKELIGAVEFAIGFRNPHDKTEIKAAIEALQDQLGMPLRYSLVMDTLPDISSSKARHAIAQQLDLSALLPEPVIRIVSTSAIY